MTPIKPSIGARARPDLRRRRVSTVPHRHERRDRRAHRLQRRVDPGAVRHRRAALGGRDESVTDMAVQAAGKALAHSGVAPEQVGAVIVSTVTHLLQTPSSAADVAHRLGAASAAAFDVSAACAGFCYGVGLANDMVRGGSASYVLVIGVEKLSDHHRSRRIARRRSSSATAPARWSSDRPTSPASGPPSGVPMARSWTPSSRTRRGRSTRPTPTPPFPRCGWPDSRFSDGRCSRWPRSRGERSTPRAYVPRTSTPSSRTRRTCASRTR